MSDTAGDHEAELRQVLADVNTGREHSDWHGEERRRIEDRRMAGLSERTEQPRPPLAPDELCVQDEVISYIETSKRTGIAKYGTVLHPHNGRDALRDAFEEAVDLVQYLAQAIIERDGKLPDSLSPLGLASMRARCGTASIGYSIEWFPPDPEGTLEEHAALTLFDSDLSAQRILWSSDGDTVEALAAEAVTWLKGAREADAEPTPVDA